MPGVSSPMLQNELLREPRPRGLGRWDPRRHNRVMHVSVTWHFMESLLAPIGKPGTRDPE